MKESGKLPKNRMLLISFFYFFGYLFLYMPNRDQLQEIFPAFLYEIILILVDFFIVAVVAMLVYGWLKDQFDQDVRNWMVYSFGFLFVLLVNGFFKILNAGMLNVNENQLYQYFKSFPYAFLVYTLIFAPFIEEIIFRGYIGNLFSKSRYTGMLVSSVLFGTLHAIAGITRGLDVFLVYSLQYSCCGAVLYYCMKTGNSVFTSMAVHFMTNLLAVTVMLL
jgi:membrane protease YdiL (CAAX protease family)